MGLMGLMGLMGGLGVEDLLDLGVDGFVVVVDGGVGAEVVGVAFVVAEDGVGVDVEDGGAGYAVVSGVAAEVLAHLGAGPREGAAVGAAGEVGAGDAPGAAD